MKNIKEKKFLCWLLNRPKEATEKKEMKEEQQKQKVDWNKK